MKAISLWEPWASLIRTGAKKWETRHWRTSYRGKLLICAAKRKHIGELLHLLADQRFQRGLAPLVKEFWAGVGICDLNFGKAVVIVDLTDCRPTYDMTPEEIGTDVPFGDFSTGRYGWKLENLRVIEPFPVKGSQGFFNVPDEIINKYNPVTKEEY